MPLPMATKIFTSDLRVGMFVADLDRPWVDTPFLLQGFLIEDDEQIRELMQPCHFVMVDRQSSTGEEYAPPALARPSPQEAGSRSAGGAATPRTAAPRAPGDVA